MSDARKLARVRQVLREFAPPERNNISDSEMDEKIYHFSQLLKNLVMHKKNVKNRKTQIELLINIGKKYAEILENMESNIIKNLDHRLFTSRSITLRAIMPPNVNIFPPPPVRDFYFQDEIEKISVYSKYISECAALSLSEYDDGVDDIYLCVEHCYSMIAGSFSEYGLGKITRTGQNTAKGHIDTIGAFYEINVEMYDYALGERIYPHAEGGDVFQNAINDFLDTVAMSTHSRRRDSKD